MNGVPTTLRFALERNAHASRLARRRVQEALGDDVPIRFIRDTILLTSELVTNAMIHTTEGCEVCVVFDQCRSHIRVEVSDTSLEPLNPRAPGPTDVGGLGLQLVSEIATTWGSTRQPSGKTVWFEISGE